MEGVFGEPFGREGARDLGDGELSRVDGGVHSHRHEVAKPIDGAAQEVEPWAEVGDGGGCESPGGGQDGFGFSDEGHGLGFGERKVADERGFTRCGVRVRVRREIDVFEWRLAADCHQIQSGLIT